MSRSKNSSAGRPARVRAVGARGFGYLSPVDRDEPPESFARPPLRRVSVVIPAFEQAQELDLQLRAVVAQELPLPYEVIVADNGSRDGTAEVIRRWERVDPRVHGVDASARRGPGAARNIGGAAASGDALAFCDADDIVATGWLASLVRALDNAEIAAGAIDLGSLNVGGRIVTVEEYSSPFDFLPAALGANFAVRTAAFRDAGGFDEALRAGEDIDLSWRIQLRGGRLMSASTAVVAKRERSGAAGLRRQVLNYGRHDPALYRRFRADGMARNDLLTLKTYAWLVLNAPLAAAVPARRDQWSRAFFMRVGRARGCVEHRVFYP